MSLTGPYDDSNVFARILRGEIPAHKVYEDDRILSFMDAFPQSRGHTLVIPKTPARTLFDLPADDLANLITHTQRIATAVRAALMPEGVSLMQFNGAAGGQTVFHIHFHILPRWDAEALKGHGDNKMASAEELAATAAVIRAHLG